MTRMLVVVRSAEDVDIAIKGGADRLVLLLSSETAGDHPGLDTIARAVAGRTPLTLWIVDGTPEADVAAALETSKADEVLISFEGSRPTIAGQRKTGVLLPFAGGLKEAAFEAVAAQGIGAVVFGHDVQPQRLLQVVTAGQLQQQVRWARARNLVIGFAGTMEVPDIPRLLAVAPDFLLFDDMVRRQGSSSSPINPERIRFVRELMTQAGSTALTAARSPNVEPSGRDQIFVRDWTVSIHLGAYEHERMAQRVRFTVEVEVVRTAARASDLRDVVTYDLITDAISRATVEHVDLVETIADDVATTILAHPRVTAVDITVEKLDLGPGSLGCRIVRSRDRAA